LAVGRRTQRPYDSCPVWSFVTMYPYGYNYSQLRLHHLDYIGRLEARRPELHLDQPVRRRRLGRRHRLSFAAALLAVAVGIFAWLPFAPTAATDDEPTVWEFTLTAEEIDWELQPGTTVRAWAYNGQVPGPEIRVREGDKVRITLVNKLPVGTTIHWHGLNVAPDQDGPAGLNQAPVEPGQSFTYEFVATPLGTRWYHSHTDVATQVMLGLYGSFIVEPRGGESEKTDRDYTYVLSEWDNELTPDVATGAAPRGPRDQTLRGGELGTDLFLLNGHTHDAIPPIVVTEGDSVRLRLINAGTVAHPFHTHGHSFRIVATDGNPVPPIAQLTKDTILIGPGERYDLVFEADNPGVWMVHCHIENHAANGMMTLIQYEGELPTGPLRDVWELTPAAGDAMNGAASMGGMHSASAHQGMTDAVVPTTSAAPLPTPASTPAADASSGQVVLLDDRFEPKDLTVVAGTTVIWVNNGADWHSIAAFDGSFADPTILPGESYTFTFDRPGVYQYLCQHHARHGMIGTITVT
jgi:plastocyanin